MKSILAVSFLLTVLIVCPAQQTKTPEEIYQPGKDVTPPKALFAPEPDFSTDARRGKFKGVVVVSGYVGTDGKFHDAKVTRSIGDAALDAKVLNSVKAWKFRPCTKGGKPVNCTMSVEVAINLG
jgi:periplasmic protein TonB